jgi:DNA-directed RNA polymerase specialized sigma subunit
MGKTVVQTFDPPVMHQWPSVDRPETPMEALMQCGPGEEPAESALEHELKVEALRDAMDHALDERERWVIESIFYRRRGIRLLEKELSLSKTHIARIRDRAFDKIRTYMEDNPQ